MTSVLGDNGGIARRAEPRCASIFRMRAAADRAPHGIDGRGPPFWNLTKQKQRNMKQFNELGLSPEVLDAVTRLGYETPTPVQEQAIPLVLEGRDLIAAAKTGTGKTAAFSLPALDGLGHAKGGQGPLMLVVTPTRELAQQIGEVCAAVAVSTHHRIATVVGGLSYEPQIQKLKHGTDVLIATPGRLNDLMNKGVVDLGGIKSLVLDEADRMLDMGFLPAVTTIVDATPADRQTLLFSATIDHSIQKNLGSLLNDPAVVEIARNGETAQTVEQFMMPIANFKKPELLQALLEEKGSDRVIVFARTKNRTEDCAEALCDAGYRAESIHSDKSQGQRKRALDNFRRGRTSILVATDVLARGIDVPDVDHVINFDLPDMPEDYVHRIGRTGRAGEQGFAVSFVTRESRRTMSDIEKLIGKNVPLMELETYELDMTVLEKGKKGAPKKGGYKGNKGSGRPAGAKRSDKRGGEKRDFERRSDSRAEGRSDNRPGRGKRAEGKRSFDGVAKPDGPRSNNMDHAKRRLEMNEKKREKSAPNAKGAAKQNGSKKKAGVGGYNYSKFANN